MIASFVHIIIMSYKRIIMYIPTRYSINVTQWPNSNANGYAYYHRVDRVNGGDVNHTHTTGFGKKQKFW